MRILALSFGGALGTMARYLLNGLISGVQGKHHAWTAVFPLGTLIVNASGCFAVGLIAAIAGPEADRVMLRPEWRDFLIVGFCGGYTTLSSYGLQTLSLARDGQWLFVAVNIAGSNLAGLAAVYAGRVCGLILQSKLYGSVA